jgi:fructose-specific phosphotransferase system IIC component
MNKIVTIFSLLLMGMLLVACASAAPSAEPTNPPVAEATTLPENTSAEELVYPEPPASEYPSPAVYDALETYPAAAQNQAVESTSSGVAPFQITKPVLTGAILVSGTGTPGVPLFLVNVTMVGEVLSETVIRDDGTFEFSTPSLESGVRIGILLGNLEGTAWSPEDFYDSGYYGDDARVVPMIGFLYDTALVSDN